MKLPDPVFSPENRPAVIPVLSALVLPGQLPAAVVQALDAKANEKAAFMAMAEAFESSLRPEMERLTAELVQRSLLQAWALRSRLGPNGASQNEIHPF